MKLMKFLVTSSCNALLIPMTYAKVLPLQDCAQLQDPKTVVLFYADWCPHSRNFMPKYKAQSDQAKYKDWKFYIKEHNDDTPVCGKEYEGVPATYKNNMNKKLMGDVSESKLVEFLEGNNDIVTAAVSKKAN